MWLCVFFIVVCFNNYWSKLCFRLKKTCYYYLSAGLIIHRTWCKTSSCVYSSLGGSRPQLGRPVLRLWAGSRAAVLKWSIFQQAYSGSGKTLKPKLVESRVFSAMLLYHGVVGHFFVLQLLPWSHVPAAVQDGAGGPATWWVRRVDLPCATMHSLGYSSLTSPPASSLLYQQQCWPVSSVVDHGDPRDFGKKLNVAFRSRSLRWWASSVLSRAAMCKSTVLWSFLVMLCFPGDWGWFLQALVVLFESWVAARAVLGRVHERSRAPAWCHSLWACSLANQRACIPETGRTVRVSQCGMGEWHQDQGVSLI